MRYAAITLFMLLLGCQTAVVTDVDTTENLDNKGAGQSNRQTAPSEVKEFTAEPPSENKPEPTNQPTAVEAEENSAIGVPDTADTGDTATEKPVLDSPSEPEIEESTAKPAANSPHALAVLRAEADEKKAPTSAVKSLIAALIASGKGELIDEAETRLDKIDGTEGYGQAWVRLQRAGIAEAIGDFTELEEHTKEAWREALKLLPMETGRCFIADDVELNTARDSISFRPEDYVIVAFELRYFGVVGEEKGYKYDIEVSAKLLDEDGKRVKGFIPPKARYGPGQKFGGYIDHPAERWIWFEYQLKQFLPRDLKAGNYIVEVTIKDLGGKGELGDNVQRLDIRVR
ncbi:MAG: hypothetical protein L3J82_04810 [Planctomycetes bacterium]|nr:hypothetical protein [Planctomycetota bacterium]